MKTIIFYIAVVMFITVFSGCGKSPIEARKELALLNIEFSKATFIENRNNLVSYLSTKVKSGDVILLTGARDPSLDEFAKSVLENIEI